ncbi:MAG: hypothetical protein KGR26_05840, partial [Cyanobacteria bacterium REEB65]|nr:hypothetical protein [Cyanobacteria bacterium REEB65]
LAVIPGHRLSAVLVLHLRTDGGQQAVERLLARNTGKEFILAVPSADPGVELRQALEARGCPVIACSDFVACDPKGVMIAKSGQREILAALRTAATSGSRAQSPPGQREPGVNYGGQITEFSHEAPGGRAVASKGYKALVARIDSFDVFVDGSTMATRRRSPTGEVVGGRLTRAGFDLLRLYLERSARGQGASTPGRLIEAQSPEAALQVFKRMRRAVDILVGARTYRMFKQPPGCKKSEYAFAPDSNVHYCILVPAQQQ